jgi:protein disulfide-isomerase
VPSRTSNLETNNKVTASPPKLKPKLTIGFFSKILFDIKTTFKEHPYLSAGCVLGVAFGALSLLKGRIARRAKGDAKAPLLGATSSSSGKKD